MKTLYLVSLCGLPEGMNETKKNPDVGEVEGVFDENESLLGWWSANDASISSEYHEGLFNKLGYHFSELNPDKLEKKLYREVKKSIYG